MSKVLFIIAISPLALFLSCMVKTAQTTTKFVISFTTKIADSALDGRAAVVDL